MAKFEFKLPDIGEGVAEGEIVNWLVQAGDEVAENQEMVEVMTDKATVTIGAPKAGKVAELRFKVGDTVPVGQVLIVLDVGGVIAGAMKHTDHAGFVGNGGKTVGARLIGDQGSYTARGVGIEMPDVRLVHVAGAAVIFAVDPIFDSSEAIPGRIGALGHLELAQIDGHVFAIG